MPSILFQSFGQVNKEGKEGEKSMNVLIVDNGARGHALAWAIRKSPRLKELFVAPGNAGTAVIAHNLPIDPTDVPALLKACQHNKIDLVVVGPEAPLEKGITFVLKKAGILVFGPTKTAALIETSKVYARRLMEKYGIPCPRGRIFRDYFQAREYLLRQDPPFVVKIDGLASGKGVIVTRDKQGACDFLHRVMIERVFGDGGKRVIIDEFLEGREASVIALVGRKNVVPMAPACDYKPIFDGNLGPNTGGMGGYSPSEFLNQELMEEIARTILVPTVRALAKEDAPYKGALYAGLMITPQGPKVLEFNARFGDPETQVLLPRLETDLLEIMLAVVRGELLHETDIKWSKEACVGVVMASQGYPDKPKGGFPVVPITGLDKLDPDILVFHAGTKLGEAGEVLTNGGRVLTVVAKGETVSQARKRAYTNVLRIHFKGAQWRKDIALIEEGGSDAES